jgi:hypothetical protein
MADPFPLLAAFLSQLLVGQPPAVAAMCAVHQSTVFELLNRLAGGARAEVLAPCLSNFVSTLAQVRGNMLCDLFGEGE